MLPTFFVVGAAKAGTSSLWQYLNEHSDIFMSETKEPNFFSYEEIIVQNLFWDDIYIKDQKDYEKLFAKASKEKMLGEASVSYLFYPETPLKIKEMIPNAKIIISLRKPIDRGYSHYLMDYSTSKVDIPYDDIIFKKEKSRKTDIYFQQYVELGLYYNQVKRYIDIFGKDSVKIILNEDLQNDPETTMKDIYSFLDLNDNFVPDLTKKHNTNKMPKNKLIRKIYASNYLRNIMSIILNGNTKDFFKSVLFKKTKREPLSVETMSYLQNIYLPDIEKMEGLIDRNLESWKNI